MPPRAPCTHLFGSTGIGVRGLGETQRFLQHVDAGLVLDRVFAQLTAERARMRAAVIEAEDVACHVVEAAAPLEVARGVGNKPLDCIRARDRTRGLAE